MSDLSEDRHSQLTSPASPNGQDSFQVSRVHPQPLDLLFDGRQPLDNGLTNELLISARVQPSGLGHRLINADPRNGGVDGHKVGHARSLLRVKGDLGGKVGDGTADLEGDVLRGVRDADCRHGVGIGFGHFGRRVT